MMKRQIKIMKQIIKQNIEILVFCVYDTEKLTQKLIKEMRENVVISAVGYEIGNDKDKEKDFSLKKLVNISQINQM